MMGDPRFEPRNFWNIFLPRPQSSIADDTSRPGWWLPATPRPYGSEVTLPDPHVRTTTPQAERTRNFMAGMHQLPMIDSGGMGATLLNPRQLMRLRNQFSPDAPTLRPQAEEGMLTLGDASRQLDLSGMQGRPLRLPNDYTGAEYNRAWADVAPSVYAQTNWMPWLRRSGGSVQPEWLHGLDPAGMQLDREVQSFLRSTAGNPRAALLPNGQPMYESALPGVQTSSHVLNYNELGAPSRPTFSQTRPFWEILPDVRLTQAEPLFLRTNVHDQLMSNHGQAVTGQGSFREMPDGTYRITRNWALPTTMLPENTEGLLQLTARDATQTLGHEGQHLIQQGRGPGSTGGANIAHIRGQMSPTLWAQYLDEAIATPGNTGTPQSNAARLAYNRSPGEWEARFAENMWADMTRNPDNWLDIERLPDWRLFIDATR